MAGRIIAEQLILFNTGNRLQVLLIVQSIRKSNFCVCGKVPEYLLPAHVTLG